MANREPVDPPGVDDEGPARAAAVLILLYDLGGEPHVVLTRRTDSVATHKGEIALPGGAWDPEDPSLAATALREAAEELAVEPETVDVLGELASVNTRVSRYEIVPFVGWAALRPNFRPRPDEVAEVIEVPLSLFLRSDAVEEEIWDLGGIPRRVLFYRCGEHRIWGATFRILQLFLDRVVAGDYPRLMVEK